uniref:TFIIS central domain-containing protein n=1 Tax=Steinernema glaseri TaxID=37863 RepID=A0A1I8AKV4_9BILA
MEGLSKAKDPERQALGIWKLSMEERDKLEDLEATEEAVHGRTMQGKGQRERCPCSQMTPKFEVCGRSDFV